MHEQAIQHYFADKEPMLVEAVSRLVRIDSTLGPALPGKPFGEGPAAALEELLALARSWGLSGQNLEGYVGTVDLNDQETVLHILGHLDVVDPGEGWTVTEAFVPKLVDGLLYGRGTDDDKGPVAAALLAMKAVKDLASPAPECPSHRRHGRGNRVPGCEMVLQPAPLCPLYHLSRRRFPHHQH